MQQGMEAVHRTVVVRGREVELAGRKMVDEEVGHMVLVGVDMELESGREKDHSWAVGDIEVVGNRLVGAEERSLAGLDIDFVGHNWAGHHNLADRRRNSRCLTF